MVATTAVPPVSVQPAPWAGGVSVNEVLGRIADRLTVHFHGIFSAGTVLRCVTETGAGYRAPVTVVIGSGIMLSASALTPAAPPSLGSGM